MRALRRWRPHTRRRCADRRLARRSRGNRPASDRRGVSVRQTCAGLATGIQAAASLCASPPMNDSIDGVLLVDKAQGMTSHDVVAIVRRAHGTKKVGHCGTLDPLATGLLIIVIGRGTKIQDLLMSEDKENVGTMKLGDITDSQDAD